MSGAAGSSSWFGNIADYDIDQSLRFEHESIPYFKRTPPSAGNRRTFTMSMWYKPSIVVSSDSNPQLFSVGDTGERPTAALTHLTQGLNGALAFEEFDGSAYNYQIKTNAILRDPSAWYHIMVAVDTTQSTNSNRIKIYINGEHQTSLHTSSWPDQNLDTAFNNTKAHGISTLTYQSVGAADAIDGYLAEFNHVDGLQLSPFAFGTTGIYGEWKPLEYAGAYGTTGFYLPFKADYSVEGFNVIRYKGQSGGQYVGGVGFSPDFLWIKCINKVEPHVLANSVHGMKNALHSSGSGVEDTQGFIQSHDTDGFTLLDNDGPANRYSDGGEFVAWCWDMGTDLVGPGINYPIVVGQGVDHSTDQAKFGSSSIHFDTSTYAGMLSVTDSASSNVFDFGSSNWTVECWLYPNFDNNRTCGIFAKRTDGGYGGYSAFLQESDGKIGIVIDSNNAGGWEVGLTSASAISENQWSHVAWVKNGTEYALYINGVKDANTATSSSNPYANSQDFRIGDGFDGTGQKYNGYMDDFKVFNEARYTSSFDPESSSERNRELNNCLIRVESNTTNGSTTFVDSTGGTKNTAGSLDSYISANTTYGQSVVSYTGNGSDGATVGHGLSSAPDMVIVKSRDSVHSWSVGHVGLGTNEVLLLNSTNAKANCTSDFSGGGVGARGATTFTLEAGTSNANNVNTNNEGFTAYCFHSVTGYSKFGGYTGNGSSSGATVTLGFRPAFIMIKCTSHSSDWRIWDNIRNITTNNTNSSRHLLANLTAVENTTLDIRFTDTGFIPKSADGEINGSNKEYIYMAFADTREYAYWLDQSGQNNHWDAKNLTESDISVDSPTNNFATFNPISGEGSNALSEGNLKVANVSGGASGWTEGAPSTFVLPTTGKWYWEWLLTDCAGEVSQGTVIATATNSIGSGTSGVLDLRTNNGSAGTIGLDGTDNVQTGLAIAKENDIFAIAVDCVNETFQGYLNGGAFGTAVDYSGVASNKKNNLVFRPMVTSSGHNVTFIANFGQDSSFAGNKVAQGNQDGNSIGDFHYEPPTGFLALCTSNLSEPDVFPANHFNTLLYTGNGSTQSITGVGFQPDFLWVKNRSVGTDDHQLYDAVRTAPKMLKANDTTAEINATNGITSFDSDGFSTGNSGATNNNNSALVSWNWKAKGSGSAGSNLTGVGSCTVSVNIHSGFSIAEWTSTQGGPVSYGHGLSQIPEMIITKSVTDTDYWSVGHKDLGWTKALNLNDPRAAVTSSAYWNDTAPTSTIVTLGGGVNNNKRFICYAFHSVDGYSKIGSYTGNGSADGTFVYTGFRPMFVLTKSTQRSEHWRIRDTVRDTNNPLNKHLEASTAGAEQVNNGVDIDILSNGFKLRSSDSGVNANNESWIYIAFAETPFKYSNAR